MIVKQRDNLLAGLLIGVVMMVLLYVGLNNGFAGVVKGANTTSTAAVDQTIYLEHLKQQTQQELAKTQFLAENQRNLNLIFTIFFGYLVIAFFLMLCLVIYAIFKPRRTKPTNHDTEQTEVALPKLQPFTTRAVAGDHLRIVEPQHKVTA
jgi:hypothetical protein